MARPPAGRPSAGKPKSRLDKTRRPPVDKVDAVVVPDDDLMADEVVADDLATDPGLTVDEDVDEADQDATNDQLADDDLPTGDNSDAAATGRTTVINAFWTRLRIEPVEIALPSGVGYTLRAYRLDSEITPADVSGREEDVPMPGRRGAQLDEDLIDPDTLGDEFDDDEPADLDEAEDFEDIDAEDVDIEEDDEEEEAHEAEEVPLFLSQAGHLLLFRTPDGLIDFIGSDVEHDMTQLDSWPKLVNGIRTGYVVPLPDDAYELDLVVQNLRGGHDGWDPELIVQSGQLARDLAHALRIETVMLAMSSGSPLDDLDEALRSVVSGGFGGFLARRKVKKIGEQTATLGWRTIIGKISAVVDWRD